MRLPSPKNFGGFGPHHLRKFGLRFEVNLRDVGPSTEMEMQEGIVELHRPKRWRDAMTQRLYLCSINGKCMFKCER